MNNSSPEANPTAKKKRTITLMVLCLYLSSAETEARSGPSSKTVTLPNLSGWRVSKWWISTSERGTLDQMGQPRWSSKPYPKHPRSLAYHRKSQARRSRHQGSTRVYVRGKSIAATTNTDPIPTRVAHPTNSRSFPGRSSTGPNRS
jgi:hypothetical protein